MNWDQGDFPDGPDAGFRHFHHLHHLWLPLAVLLIAAIVLLAVLSAPQLLKMREEAARARARDRIFSRVRDALDIALKAPTGAATIAGAQELVVVYEQQLGGVTQFFKEIGAPMEALHKATLPSKIKDPPAKPSDILEVHLDVFPGGIEIEPVLVSPAPAPTPVGPVERDISMVQQIDAVNKALETFSGLWRKTFVDNILRNAQRALLDGPPEPPRKSAGH